MEYYESSFTQRSQRFGCQSHWRKKKDQGLSLRSGVLAWLSKTVPDVQFGSQQGDLAQGLSDGTVLLQIVDKMNPGKIDMSTVSKDNALSNIENAFKVIEETLGIPSPLQASDLAGLKDKKEEKKRR